jgi:hypothetical protein
MRYLLPEQACIDSSGIDSSGIGFGEQPGFVQRLGEYLLIPPL